jgi:multidrug efflux pump subunit AcrA (membrane-fusion protein)
VSESDRNRIAVGDTVRIDGETAGTITNIAPAIDPSTKKIEVKIATEGESLSNGDTVRVTIDTNGSLENITDIIIPIAALKVETNRVVVFTLSDTNILIAHEVETGPLIGNSIVIESGVTADMTIVTDARGLSEGDTVGVIN